MDPVTRSPSLRPVRHRVAHAGTLWNDLRLQFPPSVSKPGAAGAWLLEADAPRAGVRLRAAARR